MRAQRARSSASALRSPQTRPPFGVAGLAAAFALVVSCGRSTHVERPSTGSGHAMEMMKRSLVALVTLRDALTPVEADSPDIVSGLLAYYPFDGNADDASGNGNDGTVHGAVLDVDRFRSPNGSYRFDGTASYIQLADTTLDVGLSD